MDRAPKSVDADAPPGAVFDPRPWHAGWALGVVAGAGALLTGFGAVRADALLALAIGALPGVAGAFTGPESESRHGLVFLWAAAAVLSAALTGGFLGPLGLWAVLPLLAGALLGLLSLGATLSILAVAVGLLIQLAHLTSPAPDGGPGIVLALIGLLGAGAAAAVALSSRLAKPAEAPVEVAPVAEARPLQAARLRARLRVARKAQVRAALALSAAKHELTRGAATLQAEREARMRAESERARAETHATSRTRFIANVSHELRTPLNAIMGFSDIMRVRMFGDLSPKYAEYAELIHESGRHLTDLINDVLDMSKIEADRYTLSREHFDVRDAVGSALKLVRLQAEEAGIQLRGVLPPEPLRVDADRRALKQIVLNLVSNALKFTPRGGSVTVTVQAAEELLELVVADTGVGIAKQDLERLGRPFEQAGDTDRRVQGTGLGLSLVKALAALHGGEMSIESELGEGAAVTVRLPVLTSADDPVAPPPVPPASPPRTGEVIPLNLSRQS